MRKGEKSMQLYTTKEQIIRFLKEEVSENEICSLRMGSAVGQEWWLVSKWDAENGMKKVKLAYNDDDLQCDYDADWECFIDPISGDVMGSEASLNGNEGDVFLGMVATMFIKEMKIYDGRVHYAFLDAIQRARKGHSQDAMWLAYEIIDNEEQTLGKRSAFNYIEHQRYGEDDLIAEAESLIEEAYANVRYLPAWMAC